MTRARVHVHAQGGFTLIEAMVALTILLAALVGTFTLVDAANSRSGNTRAREGATNLAREVVEQARTIKYADLHNANSNLTGGTLLAELQTRPGLQDDLPGVAGWQSSRRGFTYTLVVSACTVDDPSDKLGPRTIPGVDFCADNPPGGADDGSPEDLRRVRIDVSYTDRSRPAMVTMTATVNSTGQLTGPPITDLRLKSPLVTIGTQSEPTVNTTAATLVFTVTTSPSATKVYWSVDGQSMGQGTKVSATQWEFTWAVGAVSDGIYDVATQASNLQNELGPERSMKVRLARLGAVSPADLVGGYNKVWKSGTEIWVGELAWKASPERNVIGYRLYRPDGTLVPCDRNAPSASHYQLTSCIDEAAPPQDTTTDVQRTYKVVSVYRDANNLLVETSPATTKIVAPTEIVEPATARRSYLLQAGTANTADKCYSGGEKRDMLIGATGAAGTASGQAKIITFCSPPFAAGDRWESSTAPTFAVRVSQTLGNGATATCEISAYVAVSGGSPWVRQKVTITKNTSGLVTWPAFTMAGPHTFAAGDRLNVVLAFEDSKNCSSVTVSYGGALAGQPGQLDVTTTLVSPKVTSTRLPAPTGLTGTRSGNTVTLTWTPPDGTVDFYRIYKGGKEVYVDRKDTAGQGTATETWTDPEWDGSPYYVTAVSTNLVESPMAGPVTP